MNPQDFVNKWRDNALSERSAAQQHFLDLCELFGHPKPADVDKLGTEFTFERGLTKSGGGTGFADVWKRGFFAWEYKKKKRNLDQALEQLSRYASALENPPLHVACDTNRFKIVTAWTNLVPAVHELELEDLLDPDKRRILHHVFHDPSQLRPGVTREKLTRDAAEQFLTIADRLNHRHPDREAVAHFINQLAFCFFAEDVGLLPDTGSEREGYFTRLLRNAQRNPERAKPLLDSLFEAMQHGGPHGIEEVNHFNGGLFDERRALPLQADELRILAALGRLEWDQIDPTIFGTLFERFLDPDKRRQIGAHYTPPEKIMQIVEPVIARPLRREWEQAKARIVALLDGSVKPPKSERGKGNIKPMDAAIGVRQSFLDRLRSTSILDPACGSGNFLYLALHAVKDIEFLALTETELLGLPYEPPVIGPEILHGIEISPVAAELARTTIWIGFIQWETRYSNVGRRPILQRLDTIECRDALLTEVPAPAETITAPLQGESLPSGIDPGGVSQRKLDEEHFPSPLAGEGARRADEGSFSPSNGETEGGGVAAETTSAASPPPTYVEATWPEAEFIVGNPPFLGDRRMISALGETYVRALRSMFSAHVPGRIDLVGYWFVKASNQIHVGHTARAGLVATNSVSGGNNLPVLQHVVERSSIFDAWADEPWVVDGAAVRVALVCFGATGADTEQVRLNGRPVSMISPRLEEQIGEQAEEEASRLVENRNTAFIGTQKNGPFDIPGSVARHHLKAPLNPNSRPNADVLFPWLNGTGIVRRSSDAWIIDFGSRRSEQASALYELPFEWVKREVRPTRLNLRRDWHRNNWWLHGDPRPAMKQKLAEAARFICTPRVAKHRLFIWVPTIVEPDSATVAIARDDDTTFGILHSHFHEHWSLRLGTSLEDRPRYTPTTTFETFPFPEGLTPNIPAADYADDPRTIRIAAAAKALDDARRAWLNPPDLVDIVPEIVPTAAPGEAPVRYPDRILPKTEEAAEKLKQRTLTKLYNARPQWLADLHDTLDRAVAAAYGWPEDISTEDALARLLALNLERAAAGR